MLDPAALTPESFSLIAIFMRAGLVVKAIMIVLALASLWSWAIIIDKSVRLTKLNRRADQFEDAVASGRSLEDVAAEAGEKPADPLPRLLQAALREWREGRSKGALNEAQTAMLIQRIDRSSVNMSPVISLGNQPGAIALTRTPSVAHSQARWRVRLTTPPFAAQ